MPDPLPGSGTISISEIATFYEGGTEDLSLSALSENLEPQPEGNIKMSLFYSSSSCTAFSGTEESRFACELEPENTYYHNGSGEYPVTGDTVYTDSSCEDTLAGGNYAMRNSGIIGVGESGVVEITGSC